MCKTSTVELYPLYSAIQDFIYNMNDVYEARLRSEDVIRPKLRIMHVGDMVHATIMGHTLTTYYTIVFLH